MTKRYETAYRASLQEALEHFKEEEPKGECVLVLEGKSREQILEESVQEWEKMSIEEHMKYYEEQGIDKKSAMKLVAKDRNISKRDVYQALLKQE